MKHIIYNDSDLNEPVILNCGTVHRYYVIHGAFREGEREAWYLIAEFRRHYRPERPPGITLPEEYEPRPERIFLDVGDDENEGYRRLRKIKTFLSSRRRILDITLPSWRR